MKENKLIKLKKKSLIKLLKTPLILSLSVVIYLITNLILKRCLSEFACFWEGITINVLIIIILIISIRAFSIYFEK